MNQHQYELKIDYSKNSTKPEVIFETMADMIKNMRNLDEMLIESIPNVVKLEIVLESIEVGSIRAKLRTILNLIPDNSLENLDWKPLIGTYLVKSKHFLLEKLTEKNTLSAASDVSELIEGIEKIGDENLPQKVLISPLKLLENICDISDVMNKLQIEDKVIYISSNGAIEINRNFDLKMSQIETLLQSEEKEITSHSIVQIKKPDYLGHSKWELYLDGQVISAKILDLEWLGRYQAGNLDIRPRDSLKALLKGTFFIDEYGQMFHSYYEVLKVIEIIKADKIEQLKIDI